MKVEKIDNDNYRLYNNGILLNRLEMESNIVDLKEIKGNNQSYIDELLDLNEPLLKDIIDNRIEEIEVENKTIDDEIIKLENLLNLIKK